jgi:HK97 family phage major capsid protein
MGNEDHDFDLNTVPGMQAAITRTLSELAAITKAAKDGSGNHAKLVEGLQETRQGLAEVRAAVKAGGLEQRASGSDSNVERYFVPKSAVERGATTLAAADDKRLVLRGYTSETEGYVPGLLDDVPSFEQQADVQRALDDYVLMRELRSQGSGANKRYRECPQARATLLRAVRTLPRQAADVIERAFIDDSAGAGTNGGAWIKAQQLTTLEREEFRVSDYESLFDEISITGKSAVLPYQGFGAVPYRKAKATGDNPAHYPTSDPSTAEYTLAVDSLAAHVQVDEDASEDAYFIILPMVRQDLGSALSDGVADAGINGSTDATHPDTLAGWTAEGRWPSTIAGQTDDHRRMMVGLRHRARGIATCSFDMASTNDFAGLLGMRARLDRPYKTRREGLVLLCNDDYYIKTLLNLDEVKTIDKYGSAATVLTGELARVQGIPIMPVGFLTGDLASTGVYTGSGSTCGVLLVARNMVKRVKRRDQRVEVAREIRNGMVSVVGTVRRGMYYAGGASRKTVIYGYNLPT